MEHLNIRRKSIFYGQMLFNLFLPFLTTFLEEKSWEKCETRNFVVCIPGQKRPNPSLVKNVCMTLTSKISCTWIVHTSYAFSGNSGQKYFKKRNNTEVKHSLQIFICENGNLSLIFNFYLSRYHQKQNLENNFPENACSWVHFNPITFSAHEMVKHSLKFVWPFHGYHMLLE